jgi:hypothetical protein
MKTRYVFCPDYCAELRKMGYVRSQTAKEDGAIYLVTYEKREEQRMIDVQLWADGRHRVSCTVYRDEAMRMGRDNGYPTYFDSVENMKAAILDQIDRPERGDDQRFPLGQSKIYPDRLTKHS